MIDAICANSYVKETKCKESQDSLIPFQRKELRARICNYPVGKQEKNGEKSPGKKKFEMDNFGGILFCYLRIMCLLTSIRKFAMSDK